MKNKTNDSRRQFLRTCGSVLAGVGLIGFSGYWMHKQLTTSEESGNTPRSGSDPSASEGYKSPYRQVSSFQTAGEIIAFEWASDRLIIATPNQLSFYTIGGELTDNFPIGSQLRDIAVAGSEIYLLYPARVEVYSFEGEILRDWKACSDESDYCSIVSTPDFVFTADAANKNICQYTTDGQFRRFISSPDGFVVPSYSFDMVYTGGLLYCSNPGRHRVESYTPDGSYVAAFGQPGTHPGQFGGCCNPARLTVNQSGDIITSEKGVPKVSCYSNKGEFRSILLDAKALGGGHVAYQVRVAEDKLYVAGGQRMTVYQYDPSLMAQSACARCDAACPLRGNLNI